MRKLFFTVLIIMSTQWAHAQLNALTETGDEVILYNNGTWKYLNDKKSAEHIKIPTNNKKFTKNEQSTFLVKSKKVNVGVWINPKKWNFSKGESGDAFEFRFINKEDDLYSMLITEKVEIPLEVLKEIALENARSVSPDIKLIDQEYRTVNGLKVLMLQMSGSIQGIKFTYLGYYYSSPKGTIQLISYTGESIFKNHISEFEALLNGFTEY
ncbi:MAG TPA: hypothetical protein VLZ75_06035 [Chitinophagales bacterium]|nr:hypothetical protein [Chitinophagales bacterium]